MDKKIFRVLTIDGGGIRGLYSASILERLEEHFKTRIVDHFDMICGTSTGGIIATGLASGYSAGHIANFYCEDGKKIFKKNFLTEAKSYFLSKYPTENLKKPLKKLLGDKKVSDAACFLCIPTFDISTGEPYIFKTPHSQSFSRDSEVPLWEVALSTAAAPTFFPAYESDSKRLNGNMFVDGGIWANNPSLVGLIEALKYFVGPGKEYDELVLISVSSISELYCKADMTRFRNSKLGWIINSDIIDLLFSAQAKSTEKMVTFLTELHNVRYIRIPSPERSKRDILEFGMDGTKDKTLKSMISKAKNMANQYTNNQILVELFKNKKLSLNLGAKNA